MDIKETIKYELTLSVHDVDILMSILKHVNRKELVSSERGFISALESMAEDMCKQ